MRAVTMLPALALVLAACSGPAPVAAPAPTPVDVRPTGPLDLPACEAVPTAVAHDPVDGLVVPDGTVITEVTMTDPTVNVRGYVALTPSNFRRALVERDDVLVLNQEDETYDAEVLLSTGPFRQFTKAIAACADGSQFLAVVVPEEAAAGLPPIGPTSGPTDG